MADTEANRTHVRIAAAILASILLAAAVFTYLAYTSAFSPTDTITVTAERAGLVMDPDAKVKYRGVQVGKVTSIDFLGDQAQLTLSMQRGELHHIPSNATVRIASNTIFGAKSVEFLRPDTPAEPLRPGTVIQASSVQIEANTLFQTLTDVLNKIDPVHLNATMTAVGQGLRGHGDDLGVTLTGLNDYLGRLNPKLPTLHALFAKTATVGNIYADAGDDLVTVIANTPSISDTIVDQQDNLNAALLAATGLANNAYETLEPAADDYIAGIQRMRAPARVLGEYSPEFGCVLEALVTAKRNFGPIIGGIKPGLFVSSNFVPGVPAYTYPESLPLVNASGGPNCRGLPNFPNKQIGGTWYRAKFLVTDNAYVPFEPNTELQFDAPSTAQFLFNGAFAERDEY
ncbi:MCE family protein [Mycobacterium koreense]|uniref:MCE-family protein n=1 Tax=Mycolicibacillus koreensis TaxID=1069220 RepID=A0A7I7SJE9_9MYCO|nr:MCE family protein [Mycolicibacillus koreensis]MCV7250502.1 MCE family protein [Mycolicibacillus koreensis]OSC32750.1 MCE-family protein [Mycolicibacillus koreensis]BBY56369.1 MCE-family protein Mce4A [Mycolicibacillus koreensis]